MRRPTRRVGLAIAVLIAIVAAAAAWWFDARTKPDAVAKRVAATIVAQHTGASATSLRGDLLRITMPSGLYIDARLAPALAACRDDRFDCSNAIDGVVADVAHVESMLAKPKVNDLPVDLRSNLRAMVIGETSPGFRFGYVTEPLIGPLEVRYALVSGAASTFVTSALADRLGANRAQLRQAALANLAADGEPRAELLPDRPGVYRVLSKDDAVADLLDARRMKRLAAIVGSTRIYCAVPERGVLFVARTDAAGKQALLPLLGRTQSGELRPGDRELLIYDSQAPEAQALSIAEAGQ